MPSVKLNRHVVEQLIGKQLSEEELADRISMLGTDLEKITEDEIHVEVFPNRPDMLSEQGLSRALATFVGAKKGLAFFCVNPSGKQVIKDSSVESVRPFTACAIVRGLTFSDEKIREVMQMQEKLHVTYARNRKKLAIGIYPLDKITFPITYCAKDAKDISFAPLGYEKVMSAQEIIEQHPAGKEYGHLLAGLEKYPLFVDAKGEVLSMPPLINSNTVGKVETSTKDVFVEVSGFTFEECSTCLAILVTALHDMGGTIESVEIVSDEDVRTTPNLEPSTLPLQRDYVNTRLGLELTEENIRELLQKMGLDYENGIAKIPAYRADIMHPIDLVEDIAIAYGYENFEPELPDIATIAQEDPFEVFKSRIIQILIGMRLLETNTYHLTNKKDHTLKMNCSLEPIPLANALTTEYNALRSWILPNLLKVLSENKHHEYPQNLFEAGTVFIKDAQASEKESELGRTFLREETRLGVVLCSPTADFTHIKQVFDQIMLALNLSYTSKPTEHGSFIPGRVARIACKGKNIAYLGEIHPQVLSAWSIEMPVAAFELNLLELWRVMTCDE
ncbi:phenylalanine--tRNA ligase subunit beta [Candidatus Woesearchaeota archaeon]|nr:MAG: phenylalanine--tRNA ligase subunit beta [Candidatus Woesearchaeota archaeon]